jgi:hypothetical protein
MDTNSSSVVISFAIAILLLLTLLLLVSYNSKCKMDNIERFEADTYSNQSINDILKMDKRTPVKSDAGLDLTNLSAASDPVQGNIAPNSNSQEYTSVNGAILPNNISNFESGSGSSSSSGLSLTNEPTGINSDSCFVRDRLTSSDLLPKDAANSKWAQINPAGAGMLGDQNFLTAGYHVGINTIGQSLRNANLQLRSEPPNPQIAVSPWGISTIEPDIRTVAFEIGSAPSY